MAAATPTSSSTPSTETTGKPHPYQIEKFPGAPKGAFEARRVRAGLYIRVDMPGVPDDTVKVAKYAETRTVTFSGKAPPFWVGADSNETRIYAGYVVLDRELADVEFETHFKNGCLRMLFSGCDGSLHFLSPHASSSSRDNVGSEAAGQDEEEKITDSPFASFISHDPQHPTGIMLTGGSSEHINPYLLSGFKGVYEHKILNLTTGDQVIYVRLDAPDSSKGSTVILEDSNKNIGIFTAAIKKQYYSRFDEAIREYHGILAPTCQCCTYTVTKYVNEGGVLRLLVRKSAKNNLDPNAVLQNLRPSRARAPRRGVRVDALTRELLGRLPQTSTFNPSNLGTRNH